MTEANDDNTLAPPQPERSETSIRLAAISSLEALRAEPHAELAQLNLQDANELRLLLRGESVVDWFRLDVEDESDSRRLLALNAFDWNSEADRSRIELLRAHAVEYLQQVLNLNLDEVVAQRADFLELPLMASSKIGTKKQQRNACVLLKVMHILHHLDARELRTRLALSDSELFESVEQSVIEIFDQLQASGAPVVEFQWSRKTRHSLLTKMLVKRETSAARVFDRLRFRLIVKQRSDLIPTLRTMLRKLVPFNYVVPGQTVNTLVDPNELDTFGPSRLSTTEGRQPDLNEFSGANFRVINFIADLPVRVDDFVAPEDLDLDRGNVVFVLAEFQLLDVATARSNEQGESSHVAYKNRQHARVRERMLRLPSKGKVAAPRHQSEDSGRSMLEEDELLGRVVQADD